MYLIYCNDEIVAKFYGRQYAEIVEEIVLNNSTPNEVWEAEWVEVETFCLVRRWRYWTYLKIALDKRAFFAPVPELVKTNFKKIIIFYQKHFTNKK